MSEVLITIYQILFCATEVYLIYNVILSIIGIFNPKQKYPMAEDKEKFVIFVPCHNEGDVVKSTVENYFKINYDEKLYDIFFIADNCKDNTAQILRDTIEESKKTNFFVLERNVDDPKKRGKPHALRWGIEQLENGNNFYAKYDMFMVLDADNFVDADILKHLNSQYLNYNVKKRPVMMQVYLDSKNKNSIIARGYFETYRIMNGFWQVSKQKLHLVPGIGGTGFSVTTNFLKSIGGFNCNSLTEDLEIQTLATINNKTIAYNRNVRIYDEKPTKLKAALVQRTRWAQGHWFLAFKFVPILFIQLFNFKTIKATFRKIDMIVYLMSRFFIICALIMFIIGTVLMFFPNVHYNISPVIYFVNTCSVLLSFVVIVLASLYYGPKEEKKNVLIEWIPNIIAVYIIAFIDITTSLFGLFKCGNQKVWKKTAHNITTMKVSSNIFGREKNVAALAVATNSIEQNFEQTEILDEIEEDVSNNNALDVEISEQDKELLQEESQGNDTDNKHSIAG